MSFVLSEKIYWPSFNLSANPNNGMKETEKTYVLLIANCNVKKYEKLLVSLEAEGIENYFAQSINTDHAQKINIRRSINPLYIRNFCTKPSFQFSP
jgi:hypothetical protein